ncbi:MAG: hypothetical protein KME60_06405 [Cyanomargarita calcarea GSE-NOS-MK-12-04C]|uniref:SWI2/SNF2 ATPase domain-containing protein n=1 Tax=Cyanomargarita calcarea GSE-NOS-MK-12-04C TaxID=2839659 RepID=A0A951QL96_9CYAN|nr:hypothetical protein [Cyanomargarita calcarea GSE-NOS-MK-12-04C]
MYSHPKAIASTINAISPTGDRKVGVVWHTQGSGKSLTMAFYAGKIIQHPAMANPTLVIVCDTNEDGCQGHGHNVQVHIKLV